MLYERKADIKRGKVKVLLALNRAQLATFPRNKLIVYYTIPLLSSENKNQSAQLDNLKLMAGRV